MIHYQTNYGGVADNTGSRVYVVDTSASNAHVTFNNDNGNFGSQTSGITVTHYSTGGVYAARTLTSGHVLRLDGSYSAPYGAMEANLSGWGVQPVRVQGS
jgi:hypothetical protein